jgi:hypothetical protein
LRENREIVTLTTKSHNSSNEGPYTINVERYSSLEKLLNVTVYCKRFIDGCRGHLRPNNIVATTVELEEARIEWVKHTQGKNFSNTLQNMREKER